MRNYLRYIKIKLKIQSTDEKRIKKIEETKKNFSVINLINSFNMRTKKNQNS